MTEAKTQDEIEKFDRDLSDRPRRSASSPVERVSSPVAAANTNALMAAFNMAER